MNMTLQVGVKVLLKNKEGKYLILKRSAEKYGKFGDMWDIVGGRIEPGSPLINNLKREVWEETKLTLASEPKLIYAQDILRHADKHVVRLTYSADASGELVLDTSENVEYKWLSQKELLALPGLDEYVKEILEKGLLK
jgi:8-oxo-dGTP pyrophosphatase MutT (NUDIX family)